KAMQGPLALATGGVDLSWLTGIGVAALSYLALHRLFGRSLARSDALPAAGEESIEPAPTST
ncbi:hypothetical protein ACI4BE_28320, partial [Klebsiella pneumoniae]|uniref:hypothetical protein n=1 Tax=Klebsiella pneumoniae TaxID=573 RepID=UPI0038531552